MSADVPTDPPAADGYLERATLLAELGRYDEAVAELGFALALDPTAAAVSTMLARVQLAAGRPAEALAAAEAAVSAAPGQLPPLVARGLALGDLERHAEAARTADEILALGRDDGYAQRSAAAILAGSRNGQPALNAAWHGVELAPEEPQAHLVLGLVAANMQMYDLAERAYREALRLDPRLAESGDDVGVLRLEQRRWSAMLERLAEAAVGNLPPTDPGRPDGARDGPSGAAEDRDEPDRPGESRPDLGRPGVGSYEPGRIDEGREVSAFGGTGAGQLGAGSADVGPVVARRTVPAGLRQLVLWGAGWSLVAAVVVGCSAATSSGFSRLVAALAAAGGGIVVWRHAAALPGLSRTVLPVLRRTDRPLAFAVYAAGVGPALILLYALSGSPWSLVLAVAVATAAGSAVFSRPVA
ncbi:tetratricopeptide repeat protein [Micromonospora sp. Llam7]|uniref:tetratricopeptide repeat protein n=1 Tax=Micromonospora tarapacensis TaxID=2835305 RepID=UPI001C82C946|nr:tetratricopeptide repeat protein [Micromonospora tarapacensis]MBX7264877.1 tetratricopeptide repeat protein [Micromonospora tarapacensis]